jgi:hypothetical protein
MARQVNGHLGTFSTVEELTNRFPPSESIGCSANVGVDIPYVKYWSDGNIWGGLPPSKIAPLIAPGLLSAVTYDSSNRAITWTIDNVTYSANYTSFGIVVAGTDGTITNIGVDPAQRITSVTTA